MMPEHARYRVSARLTRGHLDVAVVWGHQPRAVPDTPTLPSLLVRKGCDTSRAKTTPGQRTTFVATVDTPNVP